ncbi:MAG TPA: hypothetical protein VLX92_29955 [Kofleriaceae bacterium]|nr:hypothetical protein [Kofleriaceae bacterium]
MRAIAIIVLAGCGRLGFQGHPGVASDGAPADTAIDAPAGDAAASDGQAVAPALCDVAQVFDLAPQLAPGDAATAVRVSPFAGGYLLGIGTQALDIYALHLDAGLVPTESMAHLPLAGEYALWSADASSADAFFFIGDSDGFGYLKRLESNFDSYTAIQQVGKFPLAPSLAPLGGQYLLAAIDTTGHLAMFGVDATGATATITVGYNPAATAASIVATADGVAAAIAASPCELFAIDATGATSDHVPFALACDQPYLAPDASELIYTSAGEVFGYDVATAQTDDLGPGSDPHVAAAGSAWVDTSGQLALASTAGRTITSYAAQSLDLAITQAGLEVVWLDGSVVSRGRLCAEPL